MQRAELDGSELRLEPGVCGLGRFVQTLVRLTLHSSMA